jgi:hypothetical protein
MKKFTILMGILLAGTYALAQDTGSSTEPSSGSSASGKAPASERSDSSSQALKTKGKVTAEVIASDETAKTITVRPVVSGSSSSSESVTLPVEGKALASLKSIKNGETVSITCREASSSSSSSYPGASSGTTGSEMGSKAGSAAGSAAGVGSSTGSAVGSAAGAEVESRLSAHNCNSVTEISKVKATTQD